MRFRFATGIIMTALSSCAAPDIVPSARADAERFVREDQAPLITRPVALWYAGGTPGDLMCGEIEASLLLSSKHATLRYIYSDRPESSWGQVEMHELMVTASPATQMIINANRVAFDDLWRNYCLPNAPFTRRIAAAFD